jgi:hypothetical protein
VRVSSSRHLALLHAEELFGRGTSEKTREKTRDKILIWLDSRESGHFHADHGVFSWPYTQRCGMAGPQAKAVGNIAAGRAGQRWTLGDTGMNVAVGGSRQEKRVVAGATHGPVACLPATPCRASAHSTCSLTNADASSRRLCNAARTSGDRGAFPSATAIFRDQRSYPIR